MAALRAAGETTRLRILALLADSELTVKDLTTILGQSQPRISRHLKLLADAGLVTRSTEGAWAFYRLADENDGPCPAAQVLAMLDRDDPAVARDRERRTATRRANAEAAASYFAANARVWDHLRTLHVPDTEVEAAICGLAGTSRIRTLLDVGTGTGRVLELLAGRADRAVGVDASAAMLAVARANLDAAGIANVRLAQDDIYTLSQPRDAFDLVVIHQVLHYLDDPARAVAEAGRMVSPGGALLIVDFAPHALEILRAEAQHRRLGIGRGEMEGWLQAANLDAVEVIDLPGRGNELTVTLWFARDRRMISDDLRINEGALA
ncbi:metalloregulator ArsR/SmtB family transcription factor [Acuticoccus sp. MNP-M23]|uniref:ArsR/SmtB family transcription factor n=1 Tax=Acuticoccus sp. MNP-M23 TaxID=3072793 RepID=UPI002814AD3D|nr:metalloregulator ArsR/SmtB family transcription factor [Acuticoccus sp. MNP-M23]WMS44189.1 metalloregulator ArsR/SmtB family transcription factor [Acuticoccus sp. MNP-M23]